MAGHLTGSIDLVMRIPGGAAGPRFVVADYKTNALHPRGLPVGPADYGADRLVAAMEEHDYPLQALLYSVALHRYLRWRMSGYRPDAHLGGVAYLFLRGMTGPALPPGGPPGCSSGRFPRPWSLRSATSWTVAAARAGRHDPVRPPPVPPVVPWSCPPGWGSWPPSSRPGCSGPTRCSSPPACSASGPVSATEELLALAVAARAPRFGHVCTPLDAMAVRLAELDGEEVEGLPWPPAEAWAASLRQSAIVATAAPMDEEPVRPLVWDADQLYLHRYWHYELAIAEDLARRCAPFPSGGGSGPAPLGDEVDRVLDSLFGAAGSDPADLQRLAVRRALAPGVSIIAGGPGTGKTYTVARLLAAAHLVAAEQGRPLSVALAAPTGKAAARMGEAVQAAVGEIDLGEGAGDVAGLVAATAPTTIHSLLGWADRTHFRHDRDHPLPEDMVIIDETSMVSLPLMAKLLDAVRPEASVVLVGDPFQLASIEAGTVMSDVVGPAGRPDGTVGSPGPVPDPLPRAPWWPLPPCGTRWSIRSPSRARAASWPTGSPCSGPCAGSRGTRPSPPWPTPSAPVTGSGPWPCSRRGPMTSTGSVPTMHRAWPR